MNYEIKRFDIWSVIKVCFVIYLILGFFMGLVWVSVVGMIARFAQHFGGQEIPDLPIKSFGAIGTLFLAVFFSIFYSVFLTFFTAIGVLIFNLVSRLTGGIEVEVDAEPIQVQPPPATEAINPGTSSHV
jgi:hypothetical protein